jgi:hypothetical protein
MDAQDTSEQDAIREELLQFYECRHPYGVATLAGELRQRELERRLFALSTQGRQADRYATTVRIDRILGDIPETPAPAESVPRSEWDWTEEGT